MEWIRCTGLPPHPDPPHVGEGQHGFDGWGWVGFKPTKGAGILRCGGLATHYTFSHGARPNSCPGSRMNPFVAGARSFRAVMNRSGVPS